MRSGNCCLKRIINISTPLQAQKGFGEAIHRQQFPILRLWNKHRTRVDIINLKLKTL